MSTSKERPPIVLIALDAAEPRLIEAGMDEGWLPTLRRLRDAGAYGRLASTADWLAGSPWPTFYTGTTPAEHGLYHWQQWRPEPMALFRCDPEWLPLEPFWRAWGDTGPRVVALDLPMTYAAERFHGTEINGWASHDHLAPPNSWPTDALPWVQREFGSPPLGDEVYAPQPAAELLALRDELVHVTDQVAALAEALLRREAFDLFMVAFSATHRGGHKLWDHSGASDTVAPEQRERFPAALRDVYVASDRALARILAAAGEGASVFVLSLHGMGPNVSRAELVAEMLKPILAVPSAETERDDLLQKLRRRLPVGLRDSVKDRLPLRWQETLTRFWRRRGVNWEATRAFAPDADLQGYVRINLRGREARGIVEPGAECEALSAELEEGLRSFVDADSGEPLVQEIVRPAALYDDGPRLGCLPDLLVRWSDTPAAGHRALVSPRYGTIPWPTPGGHPTGRSGNHRGQGFLVARGAGIAPGTRIEGAHILDLAPTLCALLGAPAPAAFCGRPIDALCR